jgi:hypothetical protein
MGWSAEATTPTILASGMGVTEKATRAGSIWQSKIIVRST